MRTAADPVRKTTSEENLYGSVRFAQAAEEIGRFFGRTAGKIVAVIDGSALSVLSAASCARTVSVVFEGDALPLFSLPEAGGVIACGGAETLKAARFFAGLHRIPCLVVPSHASLEGAICRTGEVVTDGVKVRAALAAGDVVCDLALLKNSLAAAYGGLLLARLAAFEAKALARFSLGVYPEVCEKAVAALAFGEEPVGSEIVLACAALRAFEEEGMPQGEGKTLAAALPRGGEIAAYRALCALYAAFFACGKPRRYFVADYKKRAQEAGSDYADARIPARAEYAARALALEKMRAECNFELCAIMRKNDAHLRTFRALGGIIPEISVLRELQILPELCPHGLSALMRDFGLMELT